MSFGSSVLRNWLWNILNASSITRRRTGSGPQDSEIKMELNQLQNTIDDLRERSLALRGYL